MKKSAFILPIALLAFLGSAIQATAQTKIGTVDMKTIFERYWRTKEAEAKMNEVRSRVKRDLDERSEKRKGLESEILKINDELKKPEVSAAKKEGAAKDREKKIGEYQELMKELQAFTQEKDKELADQTLRIRNGIVDEIKKVVSERVKTEQYDLVFDVSGNSINNVPVVMYANERFDFTKVVVDQLNADRPKSGAAAAPAPAPAAEAKPAEKKK